MRTGSSAASAVIVEGLSKRFSMPHERVHTLKERALHPLRRSGVEHLEVLRDISFEVQQGEFFGIVGRNGSGKSTLLKCLAGIYRGDSGTVRMRGRLSTFIELGVGFNPDLAARDNVLINGIMLGLSPKEALSRFERIVEFAELEDFVDLKLKNYSSGMHVRLAFSVMAQVDADVLLVDEVLAVGDAAFQQKCFDVFNRLRDAGKTILFVTHDMSAVRRFCDRAMLLEHGEIRLIGDPERVGIHYLEINFGRDHTDDGQAAEDAEAAGQPVEERFGNGAAEIVDAWFEDEHGVRTDSLHQGRPCRFRMHVAFHAEVARPSFAVVLENEQGLPMLVTSSWDAKVTAPDRPPGEEGIFSIAFDCHFQRGRIWASPWVSDGGPANLLDRRPRLTSVIVTAVHDSGGLVNLPHTAVYEPVGAMASDLPSTVRSSPAGAIAHESQG